MATHCCKVRVVRGLRGGVELRRVGHLDGRQRRDERKVDLAVFRGHHGIRETFITGNGGAPLTTTTARRVGALPGTTRRRGRTTSAGGWDLVELLTAGDAFAAARRNHRLFLGMPRSAKSGDPAPIMSGPPVKSGNWRASAPCATRASRGSRRCLVTSPDSYVQPSIVYAFVSRI